MAKNDEVVLTIEEFDKKFLPDTAKKTVRSLREDDVMAAELAKKTLTAFSASLKSK